MKKLLHTVRKNWIYIIPFVLLALFIFSIWDSNYYIGGDFIFPLKPADNILRTMSTWDEQNGGAGFFNYVLFFWEGVFYLISLFNLPPFLNLKIFIVLTYIVGFTSMFLLYEALFKGTRYATRKFALLAGLLFILNPVTVLVLVGTLPLYGIVVCLFFLVKYLDTKNVLYGVLFSFFVGISFFPDLPQAKLLIVFILAITFLLLLYIMLRRVSVKSLVAPLGILAILTFLLNACLLVPFVGGTIGAKGLYQNYTSTVTVYNGDADLLSASLPYITRFFNSNLINKSTELGVFLGSPIFSIWTFFLLFIAILSAILVRDKNEKRIVYLCLTAFIVFVFMAKGANPPFGEPYRWLLYNIPVFKLFRTTATVMIGAVVFYTILLTISIYFLSKKWAILFYLFLIIQVIIFYPIYFGYKVDTRLGGNVQQKGVSIPNEYFSMGNQFDRLTDDGKVLVLPLNDGYISKDWGYFGQSPIKWLTKKPLILNNNSIENILDTRTERELCSFASAYNIKYLLIEKDTTSNTVKKDIDFPGVKIMENQYFILEKTNDNCFLPHFYIPSKVVYFKGGRDELKTVSVLPNFSNGLFITSDDSLLSKANDIVIEKQPDNNNFDLLRGYSNLDLGQDRLIQDVFLPNVSVNPSSVLYPLILEKEELGIKKNNPDKRQLLDLQIVQAMKRISEIDRWGVGNSWWKDSQRRYQQTMEDAIQTALASDHVKDNLELIYEYLVKNEQKISNISDNGPFWDKDKINSWEAMFTKLKQDTRKALQIPDYNNLVYSFNDLQAGNYKLYLVDTQGKQLDSNQETLRIYLNGKQIDSSLKTNINNGLDLGTVSINAGANQLDVQFVNRKNQLDDKKWIVGEQVNTVETGSSKIVFAPNQLNGYYISMNQIAYQEVANWQKGATYLLTIHHTDAPGAILRLMVRQKRVVYDRNTDSWIPKEANIIDEHLNSMPNGGVSQVLLKADKNATTAWIYLYVEGGSITAENVTLEQVTFPHAFLVKTIQEPSALSSDSTGTTFKRISSTKYNVTLHNFNKPTYLVFSEGYDSGWKIYSSGDNYVPESDHFLANGYANAWYITPQEGIKTASGRELTVEYLPERTVYIGQIISILTLVGCILYFLYAKLRKKRYNKS